MNLSEYLTGLAEKIMLQIPISFLKAQVLLDFVWEKSYAFMVMFNPVLIHLISL